jgi:hypothetical protein
MEKAAQHHYPAVEASFSTLQRVEKEWVLQPLTARKVYLSDPQRLTGNALGKDLKTHAVPGRQAAW